MTRAVSSRKRINQPAKKSESKSSALGRAYRSLGVDPKTVADTPAITPILSKLQGGGVKGVRKAIEFLRGSESEEARKFISLYDDMPIMAQRLLPFEAYCVALNITTRRMLEVITGACFDQSSVTSKLLAAAAHPDVVKATAMAARTLDGHQDRKMMHLHAGFIPVPKSSATFIGKGGVQNNTQVTDNSTQTTYAVAEIGNIERVQERIADRFNERLGMGSSKPPEMPAHAPEIIPEPEFVDSTLDDWGT